MFLLQIIHIEWVILNNLGAGKSTLLGLLTKRLEPIKANKI